MRLYPFRPFAGWVLPAVLAAGEPAPPPPLLRLPGLQAFLDQARGPALKAAQARSETAAARIAPASALPDPDLSVSIQRIPGMDVTLENMDDPGRLMGLSGMVPARTEVGVMASQVLPWPGKRVARAQVARLAHARSGIEMEAVRRAQEGEILDLALDLLTLRARRALLEDQERHWAITEELARTFFEQGRGSTSDLLQAQQERTRLRQRLQAFEVKELNLKEDMARAAGLEPGTAPDLAGDLGRLPLPEERTAQSLLEDLLARNPEWAAAEKDEEEARAVLRLAGLDRRPDLRVGLGLMAEKGMTPGWKAEVGIAVPLQPKRKQNLVVAQRQAEVREVQMGRQALRLLLAQRARERARALTLGLRATELVRVELLPAGEANVSSLLASMEYGKADVPRVMQALNGLLKSREDLLDLTADLHRLTLQQHRASLDPPPTFELGMGATLAASSVPPPAPRSASGAGAPAATESTAAPMKM